MDSTVRHAARPSVRKDRGPFSFARGNACDDRTLCATRCEVSRAGNFCSPAMGTGVPFLFFKENTMSAASQVNAYRPLGVLLGGPFAPQRSIEPKPLLCALLRSRSRPVDAVAHVRSTHSASVPAREAVRHHD